MKSDVIEKVQAQTSQQRMSLKDVLEKVASEKGTVGQVEGTNSLVVTDTAQKLEVMGRLISQLDRPPKQVHLSIKLIELSDSDAAEVGLLWQNGLTGEISGMSYPTMFPFSSGSTDSALSGTFPGSSGVLIPKDGQPMELGSAGWVSEEAVGQINLGTLSFARLTALLQFIRTQTKGRVIQSPQLIALDHEEATIHVGELVRYAESFQQTTEGGGLATGFREASNSPVRLGIQVLVIPHVTGPDNNVILHIIPKTESAKSAMLFETFEGGPLGQLKLPQTIQRTVVTKMMLRDRETGIIAGLRQQSFGETVTSIPLLGDIPIIGWLFRHRSRPAETNQNSTLLILVTPTVVDFERKVDIGPAIKDAMEDLGSGFSLEDEPPPQLRTPGTGAAPDVR
jgi:type II secretory pathway component GspD/PulD (secretin)